MTLHHTVAHTLDVRAADVATDIDNTEFTITRLRGELSAAENILRQLREEEQAIADARKLLDELS